jgi:hypothetical protein
LAVNDIWLKTNDNFVGCQWYLVEDWWQLCGFSWIFGWGLIHLLVVYDIWLRTDICWLRTDDIYVACLCYLVEDWRYLCWLSVIFGWGLTISMLVVYDIWSRTDDIYAVCLWYLVEDWQHFGWLWVILGEEEHILILINSCYNVILYYIVRCALFVIFYSPFCVIYFLYETYCCVNWSMNLNKFWSVDLKLHIAFVQCFTLYKDD